MYGALGAAGGYMLIFIPNVEIYTVILFAAGYHIGFKYGAVSAAITAVIYFGFNPQGSVLPPVLAAQIIGLSLAPATGYIFRKLNLMSRTGFTLKRVLLGVNGFLIALIYHLLTDLSHALLVNLDFRGIIAYIFSGVAFTTSHLVSAIAIFVVLATPIIRTIDRHETGR